MEVIKVEQLSKTYEYYNKEAGLKGSKKNLFKKEILKKEAVKNINMSIKKGSIVGFIGMNGAGKTSTLKMLSGILKPTSGKIDVLGYDPFEKKPEFLKKITMVMGNKSQLWWDIPAVESFELNRQIFEVNKSDYNKIVGNLIDQLDVRRLTNVQVRKLSLGERMKMELIASLVHSPEIMYLDEPTIGLDIIAQQSIRKFLKDYNREHNNTIILTSHNFDDIVQLCDYLILVDKGEVIYNDSYENFLDKYSNKKIIKLKYGENLGSIIGNIEKNGNLQILEQDNNIIKLQVDEDKLIDVTRQLLIDDVDKIRDISIENLDIKDIIKDIYNGSDVRRE